MTELAGRRQVFGFCGVRPAHQPHESGVLSCQGVPPEEMTGRSRSSRRPVACVVLGHRWHVTRTESIRYGVLVTSACHRCPAERTVSRW